MKALTIRISDDVYEQIELLGRLHHRKVGPQIAFMLEQSLDQRTAADLAYINGKSDLTETE